MYKYITAAAAVSMHMAKFISTLQADWPEDIVSCPPAFSVLLAVSLPTGADGNIIKPNGE